MADLVFADRRDAAVETEIPLDQRPGVEVVRV
jgi:hypothetical protein